MDETLRRLYEEDQADRTSGPVESSVMRERDRARRSTVQQLIDTGALGAPEDYFHAAMVFQHGDMLDDFWRAHELAKHAADLGFSPPTRARWLAAAALDRWLMHQDKPQRYGTQYRMEGGRWTLWPVDPATTDAEREAWGVPTLAEAQQRAERLTRGQPPTSSGPALATLEVPGLRVRLVLSETTPSSSSGSVRRPEPIAPEEITGLETSLPRDLPADWTVRRLGQGFCALRADGSVAATWVRVGPRRSGEVNFLWRAEQGPTPSLERVEIEGRAAVWLKPHPDNRLQRNVILFPTGPNQHWTVGGELPHEELLCLASSLPADDR